MFVWCMYVCIYVWCMYVCMYACMYVYMHVCIMHVCMMFVLCMYVCMYVHMCVCVYTYVCVYFCTSTRTFWKYVWIHLKFWINVEPYRDVQERFPDEAENKHFRFVTNLLQENRPHNKFTTHIYQVHTLATYFVFGINPREERNGKFNQPNTINWVENTSVILYTSSCSERGQAITVAHRYRQVAALPSNATHFSTSSKLWYRVLL